MAQKIKVALTDDLTGEPAERTVRFALNGQHYETELPAENIAALTDVFAPYIRHGRHVSAVKRTRSAEGSRPAKAMREQIREWVRSNGREISDRGRLPRDLVTAYEREYVS